MNIGEINMRMQQNKEHIKNDALTEQIISAAIQVHRELGPGLLESTFYQFMKHNYYPI